jgi:hypothetical protein
MLTDLFASVHRLIRAKQRIKWHWLPLLVAWYVLIIILKNWWSLVFGGNGGGEVSGWLFFYYAHLLFLFYLVVSAVLPDEVPECGLDLKEFYIESRRHFWGLLAAVNLLLLFAAIVQPAFSGEQFIWLPVIANLVMFAVNLSLTWVRNLAYHSVIVSLFLGQVLLEVFQNL